MQQFQTIESLTSCMLRLGASTIYCKTLAENDNTKQQIYLGNSFDILKLLKFGSIRTEPGGKRPNFKASVPLFWIDGDGNTEAALGAQLILYPDYPEVRLSGFLRNCTLAPSAHLQPIPKEHRKFNNGVDGRILFFGVSQDKVFVYLAPSGTALSNQTIQTLSQPIAGGSVLRIVVSSTVSSRDILLAKLREIQSKNDEGWHTSMRLNKTGTPISYTASNGGGYTLEALFGIIPNGLSAPDFMGWELKAYSGSRITLMTPEPNSGFYGENGVGVFLRRYGRHLNGDIIYFTGSHKVNIISTTSGHTLIIHGFDPKTEKITDVCGGIRLTDEQGIISAEWTFGGLIEQWGRKHAAAAYIHYEKSSTTPPNYRYGHKKPIFLGEGTNFKLFLSALASGNIIYDPASKMLNASEKKSTTKARNQFRMNVKDLHRLYLKFEAIKL